MRRRQRVLEVELGLEVEVEVELELGLEVELELELGLEVELGGCGEGQESEGRRIYDRFSRKRCSLRRTGRRKLRRCGAL